jgi:hypothetical protein
MRKIPEKLTKRESKPRWNWAKRAQRNDESLIVKDVIYKIEGDAGGPYTHFIIKDWDKEMSVFILRTIDKRNDVRYIRVVSLAFKSLYLWPSRRIFDKREILKVALRGLIP